MGMKRIVLVLAALSGCASTGVIQTDPGVYMLAKQSAGGLFVSGEEVKADLYIEANAFCAKQGGRQVQTINAESANAIPFAHTSQAKIAFRCVDPRAPEIAHPASAAQTG